MAIDTIVSDAVKAQHRFRSMAIKTTGHRMSAHQGKAIVLVQFCDIVHQPIVGRVAAGTIRTDRHLVHVQVAGDTIGLRFRKYEGLVAVPAIRAGMLAGEREVSFVVVEKGRIGGQWQPRRP